MNLKQWEAQQTKQQKHTPIKGRKARQRQQKQQRQHGAIGNRKAQNIARPSERFWSSD